MVMGVDLGVRWCAGDAMVEGRWRRRGREKSGVEGRILSMFMYGWCSNV